MQPGDEILLMSGQYGDVNIGIYGTPMTNPAFVTIAAAPGQTPVLATLYIARPTCGGFSIFGSEPGKDQAWSPSRIKDRRCRPPTSFSNMQTVIAAPEDVDGWTQAGGSPTRTTAAFRR